MDLPCRKSIGAKRGTRRSFAGDRLFTVSASDYFCPVLTDFSDIALGKAMVFRWGSLT